MIVRHCLPEKQQLLLLLLSLLVHPLLLLEGSNDLLVQLFVGVFILVDIGFGLLLLLLLLGFLVVQIVLQFAPPL